MIDAQTYGQFLRYAVVGLTSNLLLYLAYLGLTAAGLGHKTAMTLLYITGGLLTFIANRAWSFRHQGEVNSAFVRYVTAYVIGYALNFAMLWLAVDQFNLPHQWVQAVAIVVVAFSLFVLHRYWVFAPAIRGRTS